MKEDLLQYIWQFGLFNTSDLQTVAGDSIEIQKQGQLNTDAGPDFFSAKIKIGKTLWAGNVEIHIKSSDWKKHKHSENAAYNNVVLHVVWEHDVEVHRQNNTPIPTFEKKHYLDDHVQSRDELNSWIS